MRKAHHCVHRPDRQPRACDHDGTATGRLRLNAARSALIKEVACERCGDVLSRLGTEPYAALPQLEGLLSAAA